MASKKFSEKARQGASSPEARAKAVATMKRRREEKQRAENEKNFTQGDFKSPTEGSIPLDAIPDREPKRKYKRKAPTEIVGNADARVELALELAKMFNKLIGEGK